MYIHISYVGNLGLADEASNLPSTLANKCQQQQLSNKDESHSLDQEIQNPREEPGKGKMTQKKGNFHVVNHLVILLVCAFSNINLMVTATFLQVYAALVVGHGALLVLDIL